MKIKIIIVATIFFVAISSLTSIVYAFSLQDEAKQFLNKICNKTHIRGINAVLCYFNIRITELENLLNNLKANSGKRIFDYKAVRGSGLDIDAPTSPIETPDRITVTCPQACVLWVNYDVDTRNTQSSGNAIGYNHLYHIFIDDIDQAVYNQVSAPIPNAAYPVSVNGVFPVSAGQHEVSIYVKVTGGHLQQFTSHLQVLALEQ